MEVLYQLSYEGTCPMHTNRPRRRSTLKAAALASAAAWRVAVDVGSGGGRIRTSVGSRRQIYSLLPLTTRAPLQYSIVKPGMGVEPITCGLQDRCSAVEPPRRSGLGDRSEATGIVASLATYVKILVSSVGRGATPRSAELSRARTR